MAVVNFVMDYYIWFLSGIIIVLLAIIGAYADKTNFGQGKKNSEMNEENLDKINLNNKKLSDFVENNNNTIDSSKDSNLNNGMINVSPTNNINNVQDNANNLNDVNVTLPSNVSTPLNVNGNQNDSSLVSNSNNLNNNEITSESLNLDEKLKKLDNEINDILPEKDIIDSSILEDVSDMNLDFKKDDLFNKKDDLGISDLKLPEIKKPRKEKEDVWKK